ncbi:MAG: glycosyltransferase family 4 protein [Candidatus Reddybacter sp.]
MHIGIVSPEFPPDIGGVETYAYEYSKALAELGHQVTVFTSANKISYVYDEGFDVIPELRIRRRLDSPTLCNYKVDAWHVMNAAYSWLAVDANCPVVISIHGNDFLQPYLNIGRPDLARFNLLWRFKSVLRDFDKRIGQSITKRTLHRTIDKATHIFTNSQYTEQVFLNHFPACRGLTSPAMVGLGSDFLKVAHKDTDTDCPQLITISRLSEPRKNIDLVLQALAQLKNDYQFHYTVIGDGHLRLELEALCQRLGLSDRVEFRGFVERKELIHQLCVSDLFILTSSILPGSHEGFGIVYLEAAACGTPSLAAKLAGAVEAIEDGVSGYYVERPNKDSIKLALKQFINGSISFKPVVCQTFAHSFSWKTIAEKTLPYYSDSN